MSSIILGRRLIGEAASKLAQQTAVDTSGGGAIQLGPRMRKKKPSHIVPAAPLPKIAADDVPPVPVAAVPVAKPQPTGLSEDDAEVLLAEDPNRWDAVAEAESKRAEGWRPRIARMLLNAATEAKAKPMSAEIRAHLERIAEIGAKAEAERLTAAVNATGGNIGTGDPSSV
jgi:hypothetical protein